jgi:uncharacterized RDD family membrane protein YckC
MPSLTNELLLQTPEGVRFRFRLAGPATRLFALFIDFACITLLSSFVTSCARLLNVISADLFFAAVTIAYFILTVGYFLSLEWIFRGQTPGKRVMKLRVVDADGLRLRFSQVVVRNLLRVVDALPLLYTVGGIALLLSPKLQRLGDIAANTIVIRTNSELMPDLEPLLTGSYNSLRAYPHLAARLRQTVQPEEARIALDAILRRDELESAARVDLFTELAAYFRSLVSFPEESVIGLTDEQYVRNIVDLLFRPRVSGADAPPRIGETTNRRRDTAPAPQ